MSSYFGRLKWFTGYVLLMGSTWTNVTVEPADDIPDELKSSANPPTPEEVVKVRLEEFGEYVYNDDYPSIQRGRTPNPEELAQEIADTMPAHRILIIRVSDSTHAGSGILYTVEDGTVEEVDSWDGYERAKGHDVVGYFKDEHQAYGTAESPY